MDAHMLNKELRKVRTNQQLNFLISKSKYYQIISVLHYSEVETLKIEDGYAYYTYLDSNITGRCKVEKLHSYIKFD